MGPFRVLLRLSCPQSNKCWEFDERGILNTSGIPAPYGDGRPRMVTFSIRRILLALLFAGFLLILQPQSPAVSNFTFYVDINATGTTDCTPTGCNPQGFDCTNVACAPAVACSGS